MAEQAGTTVAAGGEVWFGDETTRRAYPPLRAAWAKRGEPANVVISGRNARRVLHSALNAVTGQFVPLIRPLIRERSRQEDGLAFVEALGQVRPDVPQRLIWENAPPHHPKRVLETAARAPITMAWLPIRAPELTPCSAWRRPVAADAGGRGRQSLCHQPGGPRPAGGRLACRALTGRPLALLRPAQFKVSVAIDLGARRSLVCEVYSGLRASVCAHVERRAR